MEYEELPVPEQHNGGPLFLHSLTFPLKPDKANDMEQFLTDGFGGKHEVWRVRYQGYKQQWHGNRRTPRQVCVRFRDKNTAMRFKLSWQPDEPSSVTPWFDWYNGIKIGEFHIFYSGTGTGKSLIR